MNECLFVKDALGDKRNGVQHMLAELQTAQALARRHRVQGFAALNQLFQDGTVPEPAPNGRYAGKFIAIYILPGLTQPVQILFSIWMPWLGKTFNPVRQSGDNILTKASYPLARYFNPFYRGFKKDKPGSYRAFAFRTYVAPELFNHDRSVLKIDYNFKENPPLTVRRVLDELVQLSDELYLGKAHIHWWWGNWQTVAYFTLTRESNQHLISG